MSKNNMPATEADHVDEEQVFASYELAFHVLPTVAEGEVEGVFSSVVALVTKYGGEITTQEAAQRVELSYPIVKKIEGKNRKFSSAYFGWVRFTIDTANIESLTEEIEVEKTLLRTLLVRLTKQEEQNLFFYHEAMAAEKQVVTIDEDGAVPDTDNSASEDEEVVEVEVETETESKDDTIDATKDSSNQ